MTNFNLADEPCLPVMTDGGSTWVSLRQGLRDAAQYTGIDSHNPLVPLALGGLLVAITLDMTKWETAEDIESAWDAGTFDATDIDQYFDTYHDRFNLFSPDHPFAQVAGLELSSGAPPRPASALLLDIASGNNVPLFSATTEGDEYLLNPAQAFVALMVLLAYDTAAIKSGAQGDPEAKGGKTTGNPTGPLGQLGAVMPIGRTLFETILLNIPLVKSNDDDLPIWRRDLKATWEHRQPRGVKELLTWASRRVRLFPTEDGTAVYGVHICGGDRLLHVPPELESRCRWKDDKRGDVSLKAMRWNRGHSAWRGLDSLLALDDSEGIHSPRLLQQLADADWLPVDYPLDLYCVGVAYGNMSAVIEDVFVDSLPLPVAAIRATGGAEVRHALRAVARRADQVRQGLNNLSDNIRRSTGAEPLPWDKGSHPGDDAMSDITAPTQRLLTGLQREPERLDEGLLAWDRAVERMAWAAANPLLDAQSLQGFAGRSVRNGNSERIIRISDAEAWFTKGLSEALPYLSASRHLDQERKES